MLPSQKDIEIPLLQVLVELGGQANPKDIYPQVARKFPDVHKAEFEERLNSGTIKWNNRVQFTRQSLKDKGEIDSPARGIWRITQKGRERVSRVMDTTIEIETPKYLKGTLASGKDLRTAEKIRKNRKFFKSVAKNQVNSWLEKGYSIEREFNRNVRVSKPKPTNVQFENEIWLLMKALGFSVLNRSNNFKIDVSIPSKPTKWEKIDVFAKDADHVFVIKCECTEKPSNPHSLLKTAADNFASKDARIRDAIRKFFGDDKTKRLKISYIIATKNLNWSENNLRRAESSNIFVWKDEDIDRLRELAQLHSLIGDAVRFHLYASMFRGQEIRALADQQVAAIKGKAGNFTYYQFIATPKQLLPIAFVHRREAVMHRDFDFEELTHSYQRMLKKSKVKAIGEFVDRRKYFPNNIIISFDEEPRFDLSPGQNNFEFKSGTLTLPGKYGSAWIIDGQHRLFGFANSKKGENDPIPVIAFRNLSVSEQAKLFIEINKNQTNVDSNLLWDLYGDIYRGSTDHSQIEELTISNIVKLLDTTKNSPFFRHVFVPSHGKKSKKRNLTMSTLCQGIKRNKLLSIDMLGRGRQGRNQTKYEEFAAERIVAFFGVVERLYPEDWKRGDAGYLRTNNGVSAFLIIFRRILRHLNSHEKFIYIRASTSEFEEEVFKLLSPAIEYLYKSKGRSSEFRRRTGQSGQLESAEELLIQIKKEYQDYFLLPITKKLGQGKSPAEEMEVAPDLDETIKNTELHLRDFILENLKNIHGEAWYRQGIPGDIKKRITNFMEQEIRKRPYRESEIRNNLDNRLEFSNLGHLKDIIIYSANWVYFEQIFKTTMNVEVHFMDFNDLRNAYRGHMREVDTVLMAKGKAAITWIQRCIENVN